MLSAVAVVAAGREILLAMHRARPNNPPLPAWLAPFRGGGGAPKLRPKITAATAAAAAATVEAG
eukprot:SAG11_NODE_13025_length_673_cov_1.916376_1_plen_63_part_01